MNLASAQLKSFLECVDREVLRLGTREFVIAQRLGQEAQAAGWSTATLGDSLASALSMDREQWQAIRDRFTQHCKPLCAPPAASTLRARVWLCGVALVIGLAFLWFRWTAVAPPPARVSYGSVKKTVQNRPNDLFAGDRGSPRMRAELPGAALPQDPPEPIDDQAPRSALAVLRTRRGLSSAVGALVVCLLGALALVRIKLQRPPRPLPLTESARSDEPRQQAARRQGRAWRERLVLDALEGRQPARPTYHIEIQPALGMEVVEDSATLLGRAFRRLEGSELDVEATLQATLAAGGRTLPVFLPQRAAREVIVLYDDTATCAYLPAFLSLLDKWQRLGVRLVTLRFARHPTTLYGPGRRSRPIEILELARRHEGAALILYASRLAVRSLNRDLHWPRVLRQLTVSAWLDPDPRLPEERDPQERAELAVLASLLPRFPLTSEGLLALVRYICAPDELTRLPPWAPPALLSDLSMARWVELWLAMGAQVPDATMEQFEAIRQKLLREHLPDPRSIGRLVERLRQLLGTAYNPGKSTVELDWRLRAKLLEKLLLEEPALFRRGFELLLLSLGTVPSRKAGGRPTLQEYQWQQRKLWYEAGLNLAQGPEILSALDGSPMHEAAEEAKKILHILRNPQQASATPGGFVPRTDLRNQTRLARMLIPSRAAAIVCGALPALLTAMIIWTRTEPGPEAGSAAGTVTRRPLPEETEEILGRAAGPERPADAPSAKPPTQVDPPKTPARAEPRASVAAVYRGTARQNRGTVLSVLALPAAEVPSLLLDLGSSPESTLAVERDLGAIRPPDAGIDLGNGDRVDPSLLPLSATAYRPTMVVIPAGRFLMGSPPGEGEADEHPQLAVVIGRRFFMSESEVTQGQYVAITGRNPAYFHNRPDWERLPVESVSWYDAVQYCNAISQIEGLIPCYSDVVPPRFGEASPGCLGYRLPTEAEWEYAARSGNRMIFADSNLHDEVAWSSENSDAQTHPVKTKKPTRWGLYDMSGNVWEWVEDWYNRYNQGRHLEKTSRVLRGGCWSNDRQRIRVAFRGEALPSEHTLGYGFRLARSAP